ncbi:MAG: hypothetical protein NZ895_05975 [Archaeoglobaceae archaeon]|nr:hypothetical protein [Archaeoglobaceae archaeon]MCX8151435.1 hypothetical protein [Archaeoglobaceae archaeon]MDW8014197.1 hypothetical protein [Archaeoglobaceae archaeon]
MEIVELLKPFLSSDDFKILKAICLDNMVTYSIKRIFEKPEKASKYVILLKDNPTAILLIAKAAENMSKYLDGQEYEKSFSIFFTALKALKNVQDKKIFNSTFLLIKDAIERRLNERRYEDAARLVVEFQDLGFKNYIKKILFFIIDLSDEDCVRALRILEMLPEDEVVREAKASILLELGKKLSLSNPQLGISKLEESLKLKDDPLTRLALAEVYENIGKYDEALNYYLSVASYPGVSNKIARLLMEWGEVESDLKKLEDAKNYADNSLLREEIERRIKKIGESKNGSKTLQKI